MDRIRNQLKNLENTIILYFIERSKYPTNNIIYEKNITWNLQLYKKGIFKSMLYDTEKLHTKFGRYISSNLEEEPIIYNTILYKQIKESILEKYITFIKISTTKGDDKNYGSTCICDINLIHAISRRIFLGKIVALEKLSQNTMGFISNDARDVYHLLENKQIENSIIKRLESKELYYDLTISLRKHLSEFYKATIIPMTKNVQLLILGTYIKHCVVLYFGEKFSFTYKAAMELSHNSILCPCDNYCKIFELLNDSSIKYAILPYKNTFIGFIHNNLNYRYLYNNMSIIKELTLPIEFGIGINKLNSTINKLYIYYISYVETKTILEKMGYLDYTIVFTKNNCDSINKCLQDINSICLSGLYTLKKYHIHILDKIKLTNNKTNFVLITRTLQNDRSCINIL